MATELKADMLAAAGIYCALEPKRIDAVLQTLERGISEGTYLAVAPQFLVTATR
jgi:hypothetical protein